ncbi:magnesium transporter [Chitinophaga parva]|uniref:Magnesium transporter MgtE n=1 Tax=Chitinophaga parva TaxID=2169414 RepID=A0A2T7BN51_9BACT|nr:magnesium transporter [Chitinophaga parva]PUZ29079.1 magnesium transporter [Chitinophaga parva]
MEQELKWLRDALKQTLNTGDEAALQELLNSQNISDIAALIDEYPEYTSQVMSTLAVHRAASVFKILDINAQKTIVRELHSSRTAALLNELPADDRTDFLEELPKKVIRDLIKLLDPEERKITLSLLGYPEDSVGRLMTPEYVYLSIHNTVAQAFEIIRKVGVHMETIDVVYVVNEHGELVDDIRIKDLILAEPHARMDQITDDRVIALNVHDDQEHASQVFKMNNRVALPVTDDYNILLGIVTIDDILWVADEEYSEDMQKIGGTEALNEPYLNISFPKLIQKRVGWLVILFLSEMLTSSAMQFFAKELEAAIMLSFFVPLIMSSGGNSGSQASTLIIQAMTVGEVRLSDWWRVMRREILSGLTLGGILGFIGFVRIAFWHYMMAHGIMQDVYGEHWIELGLAVGFTLVGVVLWGTFSGSMLPMVLKKLGADPAVSSAPFVSTLVDVTGLIIYFSVAYIFLHQLFVQAA